MKTANTSEFRRRARYYLEAVGRGETVRITRHGRPLADVVPAAAQDNKLPAWKKPALCLAVRGVSLSGAIIAERRRAPR
jgi:prevent-host-death family protein